MVGRGEVTDTAWAVLASLLPTNGGRGQRWRDHRRVLTGVLAQRAPELRTGALWPGALWAVPERYGPWRTVYARFARWQRDGTWDRLRGRHNFARGARTSAMVAAPWKALGRLL